jgi:hypothetical protein
MQWAQQVQKQQNQTERVNVTELLAYASGESMSLCKTVEPALEHLKKVVADNLPTMSAVSDTEKLNARTEQFELLKGFYAEVINLQATHTNANNGTRTEQCPFRT